MSLFIVILLLNAVLLQITDEVNKSSYHRANNLIGWIKKGIPFDK